MKKSINFSALSISANGKLTGGFTSLDDSQMNKIKGGKKSADSNVQCNNPGDCTGSDNGACTNGQC